MNDRQKEVIKENPELGPALIENPQLLWQTSDFISKLGRRCRKCYTKYMGALLSKVDVNNHDWYENNLCNTCKILYKAKLEVLK